MCKQPLSLVRSWFKSISTKHNVTSHGIGFRIHVPCRSRSICTRVHPHRTEVISESGFKVGLCSRVKCLAGRAEHLMHKRRRLLTALHRRDRLPLQRSSSSHAAHMRLICGGAGEIAGLPAGMRITWSATRSASCSSGSLTCPTTSFGCMMPDRGGAANAGGA